MSNRLTMTGYSTVSGMGVGSMAPAESGMGSIDSARTRLVKAVGTTETRYEWDSVNRLTGVSSSITGFDSSYKYRADGMRVWKLSGNSPSTLGTTRTYYNGQMPVEEDFDTAGTSIDTVTRKFIGARGIEAISTTGSGGTTTTYPLYDVHGNMVATLSTTGTAWTVGNVRSYDV